LIIISVYDLHHQIIPNSFVYVFAILAFLSLFRNWKLEIRNFDTAGLLAGVIFFTFFGLLWWISKGKYMGFGDAKLALGIGWLLGLKQGIMALLFSFWIGAFVGILLVLFRKKKYNLKSALPFGPFLVLGALIAFLI
jgi:prepilin signal peptidase PulO-like enzyme (type II secretory pathway)